MTAAATGHSGRSGRLARAPNAPAGPDLTMARGGRGRGGHARPGRGSRQEGGEPEMRTRKSAPPRVGPAGRGGVQSSVARAAEWGVGAGVRAGGGGPCTGAPRSPVPPAPSRAPPPPPGSAAPPRAERPPPWVNVLRRGGAPPPSSSLGRCAEQPGRAAARERRPGPARAVLQSSCPAARRPRAKRMVGQPRPALRLCRKAAPCAVATLPCAAGARGRGPWRPGGR